MDKALYAVQVCGFYRMMFDGLIDFIQTSEDVIISQHRIELRILDRRAAQHVGPGGELIAEEFEEVDDRFTNLLPQQIRYAAVTALVTTVEWIIKDLEGQITSKDIRCRLNKRDSIIGKVNIFDKETQSGKQKERGALEHIYKVRNAIVHAAGFVEDVKDEPALRNAITALDGFVIGNWHGTERGIIKIEPGAIDPYIRDVRTLITDIAKNAVEQALVRVST